MEFTITSLLANRFMNQGFRCLWCGYINFNDQYWGLIQLGPGVGYLELMEATGVSVANVKWEESGVFG